MRIEDLWKMGVRQGWASVQKRLERDLVCEFCGLIITPDIQLPTAICPKCSSDWISLMDEG